MKISRRAFFGLAPVSIAAVALGVAVTHAKPRIHALTGDRDMDKIIMEAALKMAYPSIAIVGLDHLKGETITFISAGPSVKTREFSFE